MSQQAALRLEACCTSSTCMRTLDPRAAEKHLLFCSAPWLRMAWQMTSSSAFLSWTRISKRWSNRCVAASLMLKKFFSARIGALWTLERAPKSCACTSRRRREGFDDFWQTHFSVKRWPTRWRAWVTRSNCSRPSCGCTPEKHVFFHIMDALVPALWMVKSPTPDAHARVAEGATGATPRYPVRHAVLVRLIKSRQSYWRIHGRRELTS